MEGAMSVASALSVEKALSMAIQSEIDSKAVYEKLRGMVKNFILKEKLVFLSNEEEKHERLLTAIFLKLNPGKTISKQEKSLMPRLSIALAEENSVIDLLELSMEAEKVAEEFYDQLADEVEERGVQDILRYLASVEHGHHFLIKGEYELCLKDEAYMDREDFQYDMVHIGP
jgi:rubrerythrin